MFPGQGTQYVGMGADLAKEFPEARRVFEEVDEALGFRLSQIMWDGAQQELTMTENAQPAILAHSLAVFRVLQKELGLSAPRGYASMLGYSLGEWSAICASGALPLWDTARLVHYRGRVMQEAVPLGEGAMVALMPIDVPTASAIAKKAAEETGGLTCQVANINSPKQIVLSGAAGAIDKAVEIAKREHKRIKLVQKLNVSAPFHCEMMRPAAQKLQDYMADSTNKVKFADPSVPIVSNVTARPITQAGELLDLEVKQVTDAVQWLDSIRLLAYPATAAASSEDVMRHAAGRPAWKEIEEEEKLWQWKGFDDFLELGPGKTLSGFVRQIGTELQATNVGTAQEVIDYCKHYRE